MGHKALFTKTFMGKLELPPKPKNAAKSKKNGEASYIDTLEQGKALVLRVSYGGRKTWKVLFYVKVPSARGKSITVARAKKLGHYPDMTEDEAYAEARGFDPKVLAASSKAGTFQKIGEDWLREYVDDVPLRSQVEVRRHLETYAFPVLGGMNIYDIERSHVIALLDQIKNKQIKSQKKDKGTGRQRTKKLLGGRSQADAVLATIRSVMLWFSAEKDDKYNSPLLPRMKLKRDKRKTEDKARKRVLTDDEIRAVWTAAGELGNRGALVRLLLLTGQRLRKVAGMKRTDIVNDMWVIRKEVREKGNAGTIRLPQMALDIIKAQDKFKRYGNEQHIFPSTRGRKPLDSFGQLKLELDKMLPKHMRTGEGAWVLHDLRRTARTRMADPIGIDDKIAELTLGHKIKGIEAVYNLAKYIEMKSGALDRLAAHIADVLNPSPEGRNVVPLRQA